MENTMVLPIPFHVAFTAFVGLVGLMVGSFCNVCVYRIPRGESVALPGSHCPSCQHAIAWYDNIPLLSWALLGAKCRHCNNNISLRYPILEAIVGLTWAWLAWIIGPSIVLLQALILVTILWVLTLIDLETMLLPDIITLPSIVIGLGFAFHLNYLPDAIIGAICGYGIFWLIAKLYLLIAGREGMGYGDFKLLAMLGAFMGWQALPFIVFAASLAGTCVGILWLWFKNRESHSEIPFGPYLALAGMIWFIWGADILRIYQHWLQL